MTEIRLKRALGALGSGLLSFNGVLGASIFALPAALLVDWGSFSPFMFLIVGATALLVIIPFANSASVFPESGGPAEYGLVYGRFAAFELGWVFYIARLAGFGANTNVLADYVARWWSGAEEGIGRAVFIVAIWAAFTAVNIIGLRRAVRVLGGFTLLKTLPLLLVAGAAIILLGPPPSPQAPVSIDKFEAGFLIIFYAFVGFENAVIPAGETKNPKLTLPRALVGTTIVTATLYFVVQLAFVTAFPDGAPEGTAPLVDMGRVVAGPIGASVLTLAAICSLLGNLLAGAAATPRVTYALAKRGDLPAWFAVVNPKFVSPANSIVFIAVAAMALSLTGSFVWLAVVSTLARMIVYIATIAALPLTEGRPRLTILHWVSGIAGIGICLWGVAQAKSESWITLIALSIVGLILYAVATRTLRTVKPA